MHLRRLSRLLCTSCFYETRDAQTQTLDLFSDFWAYFEPIRQFMPANCSADVEAVIGHIDSVFTNGSTSDIDQLKALFGWQNLTHLDDAAGSCEYLP